LRQYIGIVFHGPSKHACLDALVWNNVTKGATVYPTSRPNRAIDTCTNIVGSEDFAKRFKQLKSQYEATTYCAGNVEQAFKNVTLNDMTQAPEILKSMTASIDGDVAKISKVHEQISDLAEKMELSKKAMKTLTKIYHAMCLQGARAAENQSHAEQGIEHR
jgi:hypothetical protein